MEIKELEQTLTMSLSERLGECLRLLAAATPGPWSVLRAPFGKSLGKYIAAWSAAESAAWKDERDALFLALDRAGAK